jgi:hypothetical protein
MFADGANSVSKGGSMNMSAVEGGSATVEPLPEVEKLKEGNIKGGEGDEVVGGGEATWLSTLSPIERPFIHSIATRSRLSLSFSGSLRVRFLMGFFRRVGVYL